MPTSVGYAPTPLLLSQTVGWGSLTTQHPPEGSGNDPALKEDLSLFHLAFAIARLSSRAGGERSTSEKKVTFVFSVYTPVKIV